MKESTKIYNCLNDMTKHIPYNDIDIDIATLKTLKGGDFIIGIRALGTVLFPYRKLDKQCIIEFESITATWSRIEWYCGSVNEGWLIPFSDKDVKETLKRWLEY